MTRRAFQPDLEDAQLDALAARRGLGSLTERVAPPQIAPGARSVMHKLTLDLPVNLAQELRILAAQRGVTQRYLVLEALRAFGMSVSDVDLVEDGRSARRRAG